MVHGEHAAAEQPPMAHTDFHDCVFEFTAYQCSKCKYTTVMKNHLTRHIELKCKGATCASKKLSFDPGHKTINNTTVHGDNHTTTNTIHGDNTTNNIEHQHINQFIIVPGMAYAGSEEEQRALLAILRQPDTLTKLSTLPASEIPAALLRVWKGADAPPELKNIRVVGDKVEEIRHGNRVVAVPRTKFVKKTVGDMIDTVDRATGADDDDVKTEIRHELHSKRFKCGKRKVSSSEAAKMYASSSREAYNLDADGRAFLCKTADGVERELDYMCHV